MKIRISHPDLVPDLVQALNETDCLAARTGPDALDVFLPWLDPCADDAPGRLEVHFFVKAWATGHPGFAADFV